MGSKTRATLFCILAIVILIIAQILALLIGSLLAAIGAPLLEPLVGAILYPLFTYLGLKLAAEKWMKTPISSFRIKKPQVKWYWVLASILLPLFVVALFIALGGTLSLLNASTDEKILTVVYGVAFYSIAAGIVEEMVFRGAIMGALEKQFNIAIAILVPSFVFGLIHLIGASLSFVSAIQLIIAGTIVGVMFSLVQYESDNFWNNALIHALWNMSTIGLFHIGTEASEAALFTWITPSTSMLLTGGDFGIEASVIAIAGYVIVCAVAAFLIKKKNSKELLVQKERNTI